MEIDLDNTLSAAPVVYEGALVTDDGREFTYYFRSRGEAWHMEIYADHNIVWEHGESYGTLPYDASHMDHAVAQSFILQCAHKFNAGQEWPDAYSEEGWVPASMFDLDTVFAVGTRKHSIMHDAEVEILQVWKSDAPPIPNSRPASGTYYKVRPTDDTRRTGDH